MLNYLEFEKNSFNSCSEDLNAGENRSDVKRKKERKKNKQKRKVGGKAEDIASSFGDT